MRTAEGKLLFLHKGAGAVDEKKLFHHTLTTFGSFRPEKLGVLEEFTVFL